MSRDYLIAICVSLLVHGAVAASGHFKKAHPATAAASQPEPVSITVTLPPETPETDSDTDDSAQDARPTEPSLFTPPQLVDTPSFSLDAAFTQTVAPPPPAAPIIGLTKIPDALHGAGSIAKSAAKIFELAALDQKPEIKFKMDPVYPQELARSRLNGEVLIGFVVDSQGNVRDPYVVSASHSKFETAALQAIVRWKFKPGRKDGVPVNTRVELPLSFNIGA